MRFHTTIEQTGTTTTGIRVPEEVLDAFGQGRRPRVVVTLGSYSYRTTVGSHAGAPFVSVSAAVREAAGVAGGDELDVDLVVDTQPREVEIPDDLAAALAAAPDARTFFDGLTDSQRNTFATSVTSAKQPETRARRIEAAVTSLAAGRKRP